MKDYFKTLAQAIFATLNPHEHLFLNLKGDDSQFIRFNQAKVRQIGVVENYFLEFVLVVEEAVGLKKATGQISLSLELAVDAAHLHDLLAWHRNNLPGLPVDPYAVLPSNNSLESIQEATGTLLPRDEAVATLIQPWQGHDVVGFYAGGTMIRGMANSAGLFHWFKTESFFFSYSVFTAEQKSLKGCYAGNRWDHHRYLDSIQTGLLQLPLSQKPSRTIKPGQYRAYLAPTALADIVGMMSSVFSEMLIQKNKSPLRWLRAGEKTLSHKLTLLEDFTEGSTPRFNQEGELAPKQSTLLEQGKLKTTLIHARTAKEFDLQANAAVAGEYLRTPVILKGQLNEADILSALDTGIYISNLHYLNWSDEVNGRITGMTRYACFWVENGQLVGPIDNLRFDDSLFELFGSSLEDFTDFDQWIPETSTYSYRAVGGMRVPGLLLSKMTFTC